MPPPPHGFCRSLARNSPKWINVHRLVGIAFLTSKTKLVYVGFFETQSNHFFEEPPKQSKNK